MLEEISVCCCSYILQGLVAGPLEGETERWLLKHTKESAWPNPAKIGRPRQNLAVATCEKPISTLLHLESQGLSAGALSGMDLSKIRSWVVKHGDSFGDPHLVLPGRRVPSFLISHVVVKLKTSLNSIEFPLKMGQHDTGVFNGTLSSTTLEVQTRHESLLALDWWFARRQLSGTVCQCLRVCAPKYKNLMSCAARRMLRCS